MTTYRIKKVRPMEGPTGMDFRVQLHFETEQGERIALDLSRNEAVSLRDALNATDALPARRKD